MPLFSENYNRCLKIRKLCILIPCYNEEKGIGTVLSHLPHERLRALGFAAEPIVIDNNSTDRTSEMAREHGARVITEGRQGKGYAMLRGFKEVPADAEVVAMIDGDASYDIRELPRLLEPLCSGFADVIIGTRLHGRLDRDSMKPVNRLGNWFFTFLARVGYRTNVTDVCSGFFAWRRYVIDNIVTEIQSDGFGIEMEMIAKMARMGYGCYSVPISYRQRNGTSSLRPFADGIRITYTWLRYLAWKKPV